MESSKEFVRKIVGSLIELRAVRSLLGELKESDRVRAVRSLLVEL